MEFGDSLASSAGANLGDPQQDGGEDWFLMAPFALAAAKRRIVDKMMIYCRLTFGLAEL